MAEIILSGSVQDEIRSTMKCLRNCLATEGLKLNGVAVATSFRQMETDGLLPITGNWPLLLLRNTWDLERNKMEIVVSWPESSMVSVSLALDHFPAILKVAKHQALLTVANADFGVASAIGPELVA